LIRCYNIFSKNNDLQSLDNDGVKALVAYYYIIVVFENYMYDFIGKKYLRIVHEEKSENPRNPNLYLLTANNDNIYAYYWTKYDDEPYIEIEDQSHNKFYARNTGRETDKYVYQDKQLKKKVKLEQHMNCLEKILTTEKSKNYYKLFYKSDEEWVSQIRRIILNMNIEPFVSHKGGKKRKIKNTKKIKEYLKKIKRIKEQRG
jgi:hypothetical protein